jgi:hypothetical protein
MTNFFAEGFKAVAARHKKVVAEVEAGLSYRHDHLDEMPGAQRSSAFRWLMGHAKAGNLSQDQIDRFLKGDNNNSNPPKYPDDGDPDGPSDDDQGDDAVIEDDEEAGKAMRALQALHPGDYQRAVSATAQAIVLAGKIRRGEISNPANLPPRGSTARQILECGRRARNLPPLED